MNIVDDFDSRLRAALKNSHVPPLSANFAARVSAAAFGDSRVGEEAFAPSAAAIGIAAWQRNMAAGMLALGLVAGIVLPVHPAAPSAASLYPALTQSEVL